MLAALIAVVACNDATGPKQPRTAITYVRNSPPSLVVSSPDGREVYVTYALPFAPEEAELSSDHSQIIMSNEGLGELWIMSTADGQAHMIVGRDSGAATPSWTPDGKHILFYRGTNGGTWIIDPDGSNQHPIASGLPSYAPQLDPVLSPDGSRIVFDSPSGSSGGLGSSRVYTMNADGSGAVMLSIPPGNTRGDAWQPAWSPDGHQLVFARSLDSTSATWIANVDGSGARAITAGDHEPWEPTWSPNGDSIAFAVFDGSPEYIAIVNLATGATTQIRTGTVASEWSPHWILWP